MLYEVITEMIGNLSQEGFLDGRYMAATFNMLRGRDLIWNYVETVKRYIKKKLDENNLQAEVTGRYKHFYSIHQKVY